MGPAVQKATFCYMCLLAQFCFKRGCGARCNVPISMLLKVNVFLDMTPHRVIYRYERFGGYYCFNLQNI